MERIALVGGGPKALAALVELDRELYKRALNDAQAALSSQPVKVDVFEVHQLGQGAVWRSDLPDYLLMNVPARIVDLSGPSGTVSYEEWARSARFPRAEEVFPPRCVMGEYLAEMAQIIMQSPRLEVRQIHERVVEVQGPVSNSEAGEENNAYSALAASSGPTGVAYAEVFSNASNAVTSTISRDSAALEWQTWTVRTDASHQHYGPYGSVTLITGHREPLERDVFSELENALEQGGEEEFVITGAALTGIDMVLALTEGRGGSWDSTHAFGAKSSEKARRFYVRSGREPHTIVVRSRSCVPMSPKPETVDEDFKSAIVNATAPLVDITSFDSQQPSRNWWDALSEAASTAAKTLGIHMTPQYLLHVLVTPERFTSHEQAVARLEAHSEMNQGERAPDAQWIWGRVWHAGYSNIIASLERTERSDKGWKMFRRVAANAERWAYGPPAKTGHKLLALAHQGVLRWEPVTPLSGPERMRAITQPPGILDESSGTSPDPLWAALLEVGLVTVRNGERGVFTTPDAECVSRSGDPAAGLYAIGRPTEDPVIGHDTLNHRLHGDISRWARHVAARVR